MGDPLKPLLKPQRLQLLGPHTPSLCSKEKGACMLSRFSCVQLFAIPWTVPRQAPLFMGTLQARILEWFAMPSFRGSSRPRDQTRVSCIGRHPSSAGGTSSIPGWELRPKALRPKNQNIKKKQYCNKFNKYSKNVLCSVTSGMSSSLQPHRL